VELVKIPRVVVGLAVAQPAAGIAAPRVLDLDHLGAEPGQHLGRGRARLELGEIDHLHTLQKVEVLDVVAHLVSSGLRTDPGTQRAPSRGQPQRLPAMLWPASSCCNEKSPYG